MMTTNDTRRSRRILVVDDDADSAEILQEILESAGYETSVALDGTGALLEANTFQPHIVLLDIYLPTTDGLQLRRQLASQLASAVHFVAITGDVRVEEAELRADGFSGLLRKPIDVDRLLLLLGRLGSALPVRAYG